MARNGRRMDGKEGGEGKKDGMGEWWKGMKGRRGGMNFERFLSFFARISLNASRYDAKTDQSSVKQQYKYL